MADKPVNALSPDLDRSWLRGLRHDVLAELAALPPDEALAPAPASPRWSSGCAGDGPAGPPRARAGRPAARRGRAARPHRARRPCPASAAGSRRRRPGRGARAALLPDPGRPRAAPGRPHRVAPGPLEHDLARRLALVADVESRGGATVYRFAGSSVRRAFDAGWSAAEVHDFVAATSRTPVPQSLTYLVDDVSRRFGTLRAGRAESFLRSDDETALTELLHAPGAATLRLRRLAPTVLVSDVALGTLLPRLRELGLAPVVEAADGTVQVARPDVFRARAPRRRTPAGGVRTAARTGAVVAAVRSGDRHAPAPAPSAP